MKNKYFLFLALFLLPLGIASIYAQIQENQYRYITDYGVLDIKPIDPAEMVSPSENDEAMEAYNIGTFLMNNNMLDDAEGYLQKAIDLDPFFVDAMDHLGLVYRRQNRLDEAVAMYSKSIEINDKNRVPLINLALVYKIQGKLNDAFNLYRQLVQIFPDDPEGYYGIGTLFYTVSNYESALPFIDKAIELYIALNSPYLYDAFYYKGMILYHTGELIEAFPYLDEARKEYPGNETIERAISDIIQRLQ